MSAPTKATNPLLAAYLNQLALHPLRTKASTSAVLLLVQEVLAGPLAGAPPPRVPKDAPAPIQALARAGISVKALKMALYGFLVSAPLSHVLIGALQRAFAGKTSVKAKLGQLLASNALIAPIQTFVYLASMAIINGSKTVNGVGATVQTGFWPVLKMTWMVSPASVMFAQRFLSPELWVPFANFVTFVVGLYFNVKVKRLQTAKAKKDNKDQ